MICYYHKFKKSDPVQSPRFGYTVIFDFRINDAQFQLMSTYEDDDDPITIRRKIMKVYLFTKQAIEFLITNKFFNMEDVLEYSGQVYSRISNDNILIIGGGSDYDLVNQALEYDTLNLYGYINVMEPTTIVLDESGKEITILSIQIN